MKVAYLDCASGISGDMTLGALIDAGVDVAEIQAGIDSLGLPSCRLIAAEVRRHGFRATHVRVEHEPEHAHRHLHHITDMIDRSQLSVSQKELATRIFTRLGEAEARVHGTTIRKVHFHEVGAVDSIADIVGTAIGWDRLGIEHVSCSPIPTGHGFVQIAHGRCSIPAPATAELLKGVPLASSVVECELTTPTGAAIATVLAHQYGALPAMKVQSIGCGAGTRELEEQPNLLRLMIGESTDQPSSLEVDQVLVLEANLDDDTAERLAHGAEMLLAAGALDVYFSPIVMKKNRPATLLSVLCHPADRGPMETILFSETSTLGIRSWLCDRRKLPRQIRAVETPWGPVQVKIARLPSGEFRHAPEYESCRAMAMQHRVTLASVYDAALAASRVLPISDRLPPG